MTRLRCRRRRGFKLVELLVVIAMVVVVVAFLIPTRQRETGCSNRVKCASNLRQIGQAMILYANENHGDFPRTIGTTGDAVVPVWGTGIAASNPFQDGGPASNDVTAALFLLLRTQDITSEVFACPSSNAEKDVYGGGANSALNRSNFTDIKKNLSYSYQNPYPNDAAVKPGEWKLNNSISAEYAVGADMNPGVTGDNDNVLAVNVSSSAKDMKQANSNNHDEDGQNVLYGDGHVEWQQNPFVGPQRDNIYTAVTGRDSNGAPTGQVLVASPYDANDSVLLPSDD